MSTKNRVSDMPLGRAHELTLSLDKAGFTAELAQEVINSKGNELAKMMFEAVSKKATSIEDPFELLTSFEVEALPNYDHGTRLATFKKECGGRFAYYNSESNDKNFSRVTDKIVSEQKFLVKVLKIKKSVTSEQCLERMRQEKARFVGAQGLSILFEERGDLLPKGFWYVSFDEKSALPSIGGYHRVPCVDACTGGGFSWDLGYFERGWSGSNCLLCFCDL